MTAIYPVPPNPWAADYWLELTQSTIWRVGPGGRCILEAGDDAWPDGKLGGAGYCDAQAAEVYAAIVPPPAAHAGVAAVHGWGYAGARLSGGSAGVTAGGVTSGGGGSAGEPIIEVDHRPDVPPMVPIAPVPAPAALPLLVAALALTMIWRRTR